MNPTPETPDAAPRPGSAPTFHPPVPERAVLSCGLPIWVLPRPGLPLASVRLCVAGGSSEDPDALPGLAGVTDSALTRGAGTRDALAFASLTDRLALGFSVSTSLRATTIGFDAQAERLSTGLDLLADVVLRPRLEDEEVARVRLLRLGDLAQQVDDPSDVARAVVQRALFGEQHPAGHLPQGTRAGVSKVSPDDARRSWAARAGARRALLVAVGDVTAEDLRRELEDRLGGWRADLADPVPLSPPRREGAQVFVDNPGASQSVLSVLVPAPSTRDPALHGARLATIALGGMFTSRLNRRLREEKGYTYGVSAQLLPGPDLGLISIRTAVQRDTTADALAVLLDELRRVREGLEADEIDRARFARTTQLVAALESRGGTADSFVALWEAGRAPEAFRDEIPAMEAETPESVRAAAGRFEVERAAVVVVGDLAVVRGDVERAVPGAWAMAPREV